MEKENHQRASNRKVSDGGLESLSPKFRAAVLGATGSVGQRFISLLANHPWIEIVALGASEKSAGKTYKEACKWRLDSALLPQEIQAMKVLDAAKDKHVFINECDIIFSALSVDVATPLELEYAKAGLAVFSNSAAFRYAKHVPIVIPQVNPKHLDLVCEQATYVAGGGFIVTNSNCSAAGICVALQPLHKAFGIKKVMVASLQAVSGAGYPGVPFWDIQGNVVPFIRGEEEKIEREVKKILGHMVEDSPGAHIEPAEVGISAMCHRVPVLNGHTISLSIKLAKPVDKSKIVSEVVKAYNQHTQSEKSQLPSLTAPSICLLEGEDEPQPVLHATDARGMTVFIGRIRPCELFDVKMVTLSHNTILGAAGGSIANAELAISTGLLR
eukprot:Gregarina_sp_Pseudo_9__5625@NODE_779_length_2228_cov_53_595249_g733_i0_p1_GENE_NODE_779_length_2228_cov_53_595249_g733_i0NODE_779_length_2228_cov_53_595249_g733_i0_p1_ORF_typecomplete_len385_score47_88Semialdhyde_dhC/PF02774_18/2e34Semialdhyde_dh/PF01118_24/1_1e29DXP_reductoisom/PF02670_16/4_1e05DXP_reductoisom/PF02670_16/4_8e02Gp_dh_C/PF02800_20/1e02Gp_dh_C/PF02800_20/0_0017Sacchrp_dh_NADP/PF03435_18/0_00085DapB_N/PF01113_20/0_0016Polysacc_synt_2/PF02719_15/0_033Epimerase/PF01370_21/0_056NmrA/P